MKIGKTVDQIVADLGLSRQLGHCPRCGKPEILDVSIVDGKLECAVATCSHHNYGRVLSMSSKAARAAMG